eukprot:jgi/Orpsp1_1/1192776/evm.model.d7180000095819.1
MRFNYFKGLLSSALFFAFYANAQEYQDGCNEAKKIAKRCEEDHYGYVTELEFKENVNVKKGELSHLLFGIEKLIIDDSQDSLQQYHYDEIANLDNLRELHLNFFNSGSKKLNMNVFKDLKFLSYLDLAHYYPDNLNEINLKGFNNIKKLNLFYTYLTQTILNDVGKLKNLEE